MVELLGCVACGRRLSSWIGPTVSFWVSFDTDPNYVPMSELMGHIVETSDKEFPGSLPCVFLVREASEGDK